MIIVPAFSIVLHQYSLNNNLRIPETVIFFLPYSLKLVF